MSVREKVQRVLDDLDRVIENNQAWLTPDLAKDLEDIWVKINNIQDDPSEPQEPQMEFYLRRYLDRCAKWMREQHLTEDAITAKHFPSFLGLSKEWNSTEKTFPEREDMWKVVISARNFLHTVLTHWRELGDWSMGLKASRMAIHGLIGQCYAELNVFCTNLQKQDVYLVEAAHDLLKNVTENFNAVLGEERMCLRIVVRNLEEYITTRIEQ